MSSETYQQWHDGFSGAAELERLRTENEQLREQVHARSDQEAIDMAVSRAVLAERELASLRTENERLKLELEISWDDLPGAIDALDDVIPQGCKQLLRQCAKDLRALRAHTAAAQADSADIARRLMDQATEIIRLSSPPQERAEIVQRQKERRVDIRERADLCPAEACVAVLDIDTLLADCASLRNAHQDRVAMLSVVQDSLSERNRECVELRGKLERTEHEACAQSQRIERLEGALRWYANPGHWCALDDGSDQEQENCLTEGLDHGWLRAHNALAASQQHTAGSGDGVAGD